MKKTYLYLQPFQLLNMLDSFYITTHYLAALSVTTMLNSIVTILIYMFTQSEMPTLVTLTNYSYKKLKILELILQQQQNNLSGLISTFQRINHKISQQIQLLLREFILKVNTLKNLERRVSRLPICFN